METAALNTMSRFCGWTGIFLETQQSSEHIWLPLSFPVPCTIVALEYTDDENTQSIQGVGYNWVVSDSCSYILGIPPVVMRSTDRHLQLFDWRHVHSTNTLSELSWNPRSMLVVINQWKRCCKAVTIWIIFAVEVVFKLLSFRFLLLGDDRSDIFWKNWMTLFWFFTDDRDWKSIAGQNILYWKYAG